MLDVAHRLDVERASATYSSPCAPCLLDLVIDTEQSEEEHTTKPTAAQYAQQLRLAKKWDLCTTCGHPRGFHYADDACPSTPADLAKLAEMSS